MIALCSGVLAACAALDDTPPLVAPPPATVALVDTGGSVAGERGELDAAEASRAGDFNAGPAEAATRPLGGADIPNHSRTLTGESLDQAIVERLAGAVGGERREARVVAIFPIGFNILDAALGVFSGPSGGRVELFRGGDNRAGRTVFTVPEEVTTAALSRDGRLLALGRGARVEVFDSLSGRSEGVFEQGRARVTALDFNPAGDAVLVGAADGRVYRWRFLLDQGAVSGAEWNRRYERYIGHATSIGAVRYHPLGRVFFTGDWDGVLSAWLDHSARAEDGEGGRDVLGGRFFTAATPRVVGVRSGTRDEVTAIAVAADGERLVVAAADGVLEVWRVRGFAPVGSVVQSGGAIVALALRSDGAECAAVSRDGQVRRYGVVERGGQVTLVPRGAVEVADVRALTFLRNGDLLAGDKRGRVVTVR